MFNAMKEYKVPLPTLERLATYLRYLNELASTGVETISSANLEHATGIHAAQFRKDLSYFGEFGRPGIGYNVRELEKRLAKILKVENEQPVLLVGAGNLGSALLGYSGLPRHNFNIVGVFDNNPNKIGYKLWGHEIMSIDQMKEVNASIEAKIGVICVPAAAAQSVVDRMVDAGIKVILNFAPAMVRVPDGVTVRHVCFIQELTVLSYFLNPDAQDGTD